MNTSADLVHFASGRIRLRSNWLKGSHRSRLALREEFEALQAVRRVEINHRTGSLLLMYSPRVLENGRALDNLLARLTAVFSPVVVGPVRIWQAGNSTASFGLGRKAPSRLRSAILTALENTEGVKDVQVDTSAGRINFTYDRESMARHLHLVHGNLRGSNWASLARLFL